MESYFQVGSYSYDMSRMEFDVSTLGYIQKTQSIILDYAINIKQLKPNDQLFDSGALGNFSLAGFEMVNDRSDQNFGQTQLQLCLANIIAASSKTRNRQAMKKEGGRNYFLHSKDMELLRMH